jgi:ribonuclease P protein component
VSSSNVTRIGLAVSKKALPKAVDRNRAKRLIRESFRKNRWRFSSFDVIFVARKELRGISNAQLFEELDGVWNKLVNFSAT